LFDKLSGFIKSKSGGIAIMMVEGGFLPSLGGGYAFGPFISSVASY